MSSGSFYKDIMGPIIAFCHCAFIICFDMHIVVTTKCHRLKAAYVLKSTVLNNFKESLPEEVDMYFQHTVQKLLMWHFK